MVFHELLCAKQRVTLVSARVRYNAARGITVPYPPLFDDIRKNHGFIDTRGRPDPVNAIPEGRESPSLAALLTILASPSSPVFSVGCDLGMHNDPKAGVKTRRVAGGYVQIVPRWDRGYGIELLRSLAKDIERGLKASVGADRWEVDLSLATVLFRLDDEVETQSVSIWFFAKSSTSDRATASRERLIQALERIVAAL